MNGETRQEREMLARDYVLGLLSPDDAARIEHQLADDKTLQADVAFLRDRLHDLDFAAAPDTVPDDLWARIDGRLTDDKVVSLSTRRQPDDNAASRGSYWQGFVSAAVAACLLFAIVSATYLNLRQTPEPLVIAILVDEQGNPDVIVEALLEEDRVRVVPLVDIPVPEGKALEVWTLQDPEVGPVSLGLLEASDGASLGGFDLPRPDVDQLYEISLEPETGSPIGRPTGPVL